MASSFYHIGILVYDLDQSMDRFTRILGITFRHPQVRSIVFDSDADQSQEVRIAYSIDGPPYYELIEATEDGVFGREHAEGVHHLGVWIPQAEQHQSAQIADGLAVECQLLRVVGPFGDSDNFVWFNRPVSLYGVRFEFVDDMNRALVEKALSDEEGEQDGR